MYKKFIISAIILFISIISLFGSCFANDASSMVDGAVNSVRNVVGGVENTVENAAGDVSNASKNMTESMENTANSVTNSITNATGATKDTNNNTNNDGYVATRTSTDENTEAATFMGMNATMWTWLIMGIAAIAIVALVWYYSSQLKASRYDDRD